MLLKSSISLFLMLNIEDVFTNAGNQTVDGPIDFYSMSFSTMRGKGDQKQFKKSLFFHANITLLICTTVPHFSD